MAVYNLGKILPNFRGEWDPTTNYEKLDVVYFEGSSYMAISDNINKRPDENESDWVLSAAKGEPGEPGKDGPTYKAGNGISIVNNVISVTGGGGEGGETYYPGYGIDIDLATNQINAEVKATNSVSIEWKAVTIPGMSQADVDEYDPVNIFRFNDTIFYSAGPNHHYWLSYDKATDTLKWENQTWHGFTDFTGQDVYVDVKGHMYYFKDNIQLQYTDAGWRIISINISNPKGRYMINGVDGKDYYFENGNKMYYRDDSESTTWDKISAQSVNVDAQHIWSDSNSMYMSLANNQLYFDFDRLRWRTMGWRGDIKLFDGGNIWKMNDDIFYSDGVATYQLTYSDYWKKLGQTSKIYGENIFIEPESVRVISDVDGHTKELVKGEVKYITRHGDELAKKSDLKGTDITEGFGITTTEIGKDNIKIDSVVAKGDGISFNEWKKIADNIKLQDSEGNITVMDPTNIVDIFNWKGETFLLISGTMYKFNENGLTFIYQSASEYQISGRDVYIIDEELHFSDGGTQYIYDDENQQWSIYHGWDDFQYIGYITSRRLCSNGSEIVCLRQWNASSNFPYTLYYKDGQWTVIENDVFVNAYVNIWTDSTGYFYNQKYKFVNKQWILDNERFNVDDVKHVWTDHENHTFYDNKIIIDGKKYDYDWVDLPSMNSLYLFKTLYGTYIYTSAGVYALRKETLVDNHGKTYMNEIDVRYLIECQLGNVYTKLKSI